MDFYFKNRKRNMTMLLPITPEAYEIEYKIDMETVRLTNFGDINIPTHHTPITLSISGLFSVNVDHELNNQTMSSSIIRYAIDYINVVKGWENAKDIIRVVITEGIQSRIDLDFYVESIQYSEDGETVGDIKYTIVFKEYRQLKSNIISNKSVARNSKSIVKNRTYIVQNGDYLKKISRKFYGTSSRWRDIYNANKKTIGKDPNFIWHPQKLIIP